MLVSDKFFEFYAVGSHESRHPLVNTQPPFGPAFGASPGRLLYRQSTTAVVQLYHCG